MKLPFVAINATPCFASTSSKISHQWKISLIDLRASICLLGAAILQGEIRNIKYSVIRKSKTVDDDPLTKNRITHDEWQMPYVFVLLAMQGMQR